MADLKPLGSEKLQGDDKLKRILELTYYGNKTKTPSAKAEFISESVNGVYGIVKEKDGYYVKKGLNESSLDYIGGLFMKNKNKFGSYSEALKRLELLNGQESLQEATKYVLKQNKSAETSMPIEEPSMPTEEPMPSDLPSEPMADETPAMDDLGTEPSPTDELPSDESGTPKPSDYMAEVQKFAGKLGQELRDQKEKMESDDIKYVLNMIISAVDLNKLEEEDLDDVAKKFERDEEDMMGDEGEIPSEEPEVPSEEPESDEDLEEMSAMDKLESFVNMPAVQDEEIDLSKYADLGSVQEDDLREIDLEEIKKEINRNIGETLGKYFK